MAWIDDIVLLNNAASSGDWSASGFDSPTLNDSSATTPIYIEGSACMWWPLKKGVTDGYVYTATITGTPSMTGRIIVAALNYPFADIENIPITALALRMSSSTGFTTNYAQWDALAQLISPKNVPISGHTPILGYPDGATETGTPNYGAIESVGWEATTGNNNDGKQGGFDWFFVIGYVGAHSATYNGTFFSGLASEYYDNEGNGIPGETNRPIFVLSRAGDFYRTNVNFRLADGTADTANLIVTETAKTIFFDNVHANHNLGYVFVDPNSTHQIQFTLTNCVHFWNEQDGTTPYIFTGVHHPTIFKVEGCSFKNGGILLSTSYHATDKYVKNCKFDNCGYVSVGQMVFEDNIIENATLGMVVGVADSYFKRTAFVSCTDALEITSGKILTLDGDTFTGNTYDIHFDSPTITTIASYSESNQDTAINLDGTNIGVSQGTLPGGSGDILSHARFYLRKTGSPTGNIYAKVYLNLGAPSNLVATSEPISASSIGTVFGLQTFEFKSGYEFLPAQICAVSIEYEDGDASNYISVGVDNSSPSGTGTGYLKTTGWASQTWDACFYLYTGGLLYINATNGANPSAAKVKITGTNPTPIVVINNPTIHKLTGLQNLSDVTYTEKPTADVTGTAGATSTGSRTFTDSTKAWTTDEHQGKLLIIEEGADAGRYYIASNTATTLTMDAEAGATASSLDYSIYGEFSVVTFSDDIPANGEFEYSYNYSADRLVDILIHHVDYEPIEIIDVLLGNSDQTIPIAQRFDVNYFNPT